MGLLDANNYRCKNKRIFIDSDLKIKKLIRRTCKKSKMYIEQIKTNKKKYLDLLLLGDEQESMIDCYLEQGEMFIQKNEAGEVVGVAVVTNRGNGCLELKNLAVDSRFQRQGYGRSMISYLCNRYQHVYHTLLVGTGDSVQTLSFYRQCGFVYSHTVPDFFVLNYDHPIIEDGKMLRDMIYLKRDL